MSDAIVLAQGTATLANTKLSLAANYSFFDIGVDLSQFIGNTIEITNATAPKYSIRGIISTVGTGETYTEKAVYNATGWANAASDNVGEVNATTGWKGHGSPVTVESTSSGTPNVGSYHMHVVGDSTWDGMYFSDGSYIFATVGRLCKWSVDVKKVSGTAVSLVLGLQTGQITKAITSSSYATYVEYDTSITTNGSQVSIYSTDGACEFYVDNFNVKYVDAPSSTGHWIKSAPGATDGVAWSYKHASFNPNDSAGYTYRILSTNIPGQQIASGTVSATDVKLATVDGGAMVEITGVDLTPYAGVDAYSPPSTNLQLHLKADAGCFTDAGKTTACASDGDKVYTWEDQSGNGNDAVQATEGNRPLYKTSIVGSLPAIRFNGASSYLAFLTPSGMLAADTKTIYVVVKGLLYSIITTRFNFGGVDNSSKGYSLDSHRYYNTGGETHIFRTTMAVIGIATISVGPSTAFTMYKNGYKEGVLTLATGAAESANGYTGIGGANTLFFSGDIYEILVYNTAHDDLTRTQIERYLAGKWGISYTPTVYGTSPAKYLLALYDSSNKVAVGYVGDSNATTITAVNLHSTSNAVDRKMKSVSSGFDLGLVTAYKIYALTGGENIPFMYLENNLQLQDEGNGYIYSKEG